MAAHAPRRPDFPRFNRHFSAQSPPSNYNHSSSFTSAFNSASSFQRHASLDAPNRATTFSNRAGAAPPPPRRRACMCSPTNHPGSFRCSLHKGASGRVSNNSRTGSSSRLILRRSAMKNALVRIGNVEGNLANRALAALIRPSSHRQRRRGEFQPRPSRLSAMSKG